jgi:signal transduction histidine kinase
MVQRPGFRERPRRVSLMQRYCDQMGNIVDRRRAELALRAAKVSAELAAKSATTAMIAAQTSDRAKSEFLSTVSHELRTPVHAIIGFSQLMCDEAAGPIGAPEYKDYSRDIHGSAEQLLGIINDILDLAKIDAGTATLSEDSFDVDDATSHAIRLLKTKIDEKHIDLLYEPDPGLPLLWGDERRVTQIVVNLLSNAVKFTDPGGHVTIGWRLLDGGELQLSIADTGVGIAPDGLDRIFEPFTQADGAHNRQFEGAGLGLPLTRGLADLHRAKLAIESQPGVGTVARVTFPSDRVRDDPYTAPAAGDVRKGMAG